MTKFEAGKEYWSYGDCYYYVEDVPHNPDFAIVTESGDDGYLTVVRKSDLKPIEETWQYQKKLEYKEKLEQLAGKVQSNLDELAEQVVDKALQSLASRMKFNIAFGKGGAGNAWALTITEELEKMIRESGKKIAGKEKFDL